MTMLDGKNHAVSISHERGAYMPHPGHRASCSCGWSSDCYAQMSDTERAIEVHLRQRLADEAKGTT